MSCEQKLYPCFGAKSVYSLSIKIAVYAGAEYNAKGAKARETQRYGKMPAIFRIRERVTTIDHRKRQNQKISVSIL